MADFLHVDDCPRAVDILLAVRHGRDVPGVEPEPNGLSVDWDRIEASYLSTTESAACRLAHVVAAMERHGGGWSGDIGDTIRAAVSGLVGAEKPCLS